MSTDFYLPVAESAAGVALRTGLNCTGVENALKKLLIPYCPASLAVRVRRLPDGIDGLCVRVTEIQPYQENGPAQWRCTAEVIGRAEAERELLNTLAVLAQRCPLAGGAVTTPDGSTVCFNRITAGTATLDEVEHGGVRKASGRFPLFLTVDMRRSHFVPAAAGEEAGRLLLAHRRWAALPVSQVELACVELFELQRIFPAGCRIGHGSLPDYRDGVCVQVIRQFPRSEVSRREFEVKIHGRGTPESGFLDCFSRLAAGLPLADRPVLCDGARTVFSLAYQIGPLHIRPVRIFGREKVEVDFSCRLGVNVDECVMMAADLPSARPPDRNCGTLAVDRVERALNKYVADRLALTVDREVCRGEFPVAWQSGPVKVVTRFVRLAPLNAESGWDVQFELVVRESERDEMLQWLSRLDGLFPVYDLELTDGEWRLPALAILKEQQRLAEATERGRRYYTAILQLAVKV